MAEDTLARPTRAGVAIWLDDLSRSRLAEGDLVRLIRDRHVVGVTGNPTTFRRAIGGSPHYDRQIHDLAARGIDVERALRWIRNRDAAWACDLLRPAYDAGHGADGRVSIGVDPRLAHDTGRTVAEAHLLWWLADRPNLFIKIPATVAGLRAITACLADGISVHATAIFSRPRYAAVLEAFVRGVEGARAAGRDLTGLASVASISIDRADTEIDRRLAAIGSPEARSMQGRSGLATARLAFRTYDEVFTSDRWRALARAGARRQRWSWASTRVRDPARPDVRYLVVADHRVLHGDTVRSGHDDAAATTGRIARLGIDLDDVANALEHDGLASLQASWSRLADTLEHRLAAARRGGAGEDGPP